MEPWHRLVDSFELEDRLLRTLVAAFPRELREKTGAAGELSCKSTLAHLAFWDGFTVDFFKSRLDPGTCPAPPPADFEDWDRAALDRWGSLPFGEILARYLEATLALRDFLANYWERLTAKERQQFWVPLRHHRDHRLGLEKVLSTEGKKAALDSLAHEA